MTSSDLQKLKGLFLSDTQQICRDVCHEINVEINSKTIELATEFAWKKLELYSTDLEQFANHGKRQTITADDVKLLVRRNTSLVTYMNTIEDTSANTRRKKKDDKDDDC